MRPFWQTKLGKLVISGCGAQIGLLLSLSGVLLVLLFCGLCTLANVVSLSLSQEVMLPAVDASAQTQVVPSDIALLQQRVELLTGKVITIRANAPYPTPTLPPPPPRPIVLAAEGSVNLRSGPGDAYFKVGRLAKGESLEIVGRNNDSSWWLVAAPGGNLAWVSVNVVASYNVTADIPVVTIPGLLVQSNNGNPVVEAASLPVPTPAAAGAAAPTILPATGSLPPLPAGTPTAAASASRRFVRDTLGYKQLVRRLLLPTVSESFSPDGSQIAMTEKITLYTINTDGANSRVLLEDNDQIDLVGDAVWSPNGLYLALVVNRLQNCNPCRTVGLVHLIDGTLTLLDPPPNSALDKPRWTEEGRLLTTAYLNDPAQGVVYVYNISGQGQAATGDYLLSSSHDGQKWFPWQPGKSWRAGSPGPVDSYYNDEP